MRYKSINELRFELEVKVRYHDKRRSFFDLWHKTVSWISVFAGSAAAVAFWTWIDDAGVETKWLGVVGGMALAAVNALDVIVGFAERARLHDALYRRCVELDVRVLKCDGSPDELRSAEADLLMIERDEPPGYYALYSDCWNDTVDALGLKLGKRKISWPRRWFRNYFQFSPEDFPPALS